MLSTMPRLVTRRHPRLRHAAATALFALVSSPSSAFVASTSFVVRQNSVSTRSFGENSNVALGFRGGSQTPKKTVSTSSSSHHKPLTSVTMTATTTGTADTASATNMTPASKLEALREKMKELNLDVYLIPSDDPHLSEYVPAAYMRRQFLSGFRGSAGTAVVTQTDALLWTDSRYWNEAKMQIDSSLWTLMKQGQPKVPTISKWLAELATKQYPDSKTSVKVGIDPYVHPASFAKEVKDAFSDAAKKDLNMEDESVKIGELDTSNANLIDPIWGDVRPEVPYSAFRVHPLEYAGVSYQDKVAKIRKEMETKKATLSVFCTLDDVAYLLNMRAMGDIDTSPVGIAYATVTNDAITLYCDPRKVESPKIQEHLKGVTLKPYDDIVTDVETHCAASSTNKVWMDASRANYALKSVIPEKALVDNQNAVTPMKAVKNQQELEGMRQAHLADGVAMANFMAEMCERILEKGESISEVEVDLVLTGYRAEQPGFLECSFPTIAGVGGNAAIIHYRAKEGELMKYLDTSAPILIDSGGQYTYGTTDVTRTWHFGTPTEEFKDTFTRVLKGHIGVDSMIFPEHTPGFVLDVFARQYLWESGKDYGHGTGHGVGAALNVHEGPFGISPRFANIEGLKNGFVVSNEPGYYEDGNFGIRIENLLEIAFVKPEHSDQSEEETAKATEKRFLKFHKLTMIPIQKNLINMDLITDAELDWLDVYHEEVFAKISPLLEADSPAMKWLETSCTKVDRN